MCTARRRRSALRAAASSASPSTACRRRRGTTTVLTPMLLSFRGPRRAPAAASSRRSRFGNHLGLGQEPRWRFGLSRRRADPVDQFVQERANARVRERRGQAGLNLAAVERCDRIVQVHHPVPTGRQPELELASEAGGVQAKIRAAPLWRSYRCLSRPSDGRQRSSSSPADATVPSTAASSMISRVMQASPVDNVRRGLEHVEQRVVTGGVRDVKLRARAALSSVASSASTRPTSAPTSSGSAPRSISR